MAELNKENINIFLDYYHDLHDSYIMHIRYDVAKSQIELLIDVYWAGNINQKNDKSNMNKMQLKMYFNLVVKYNCKDIDYSDYINQVYIKYIKLEDKEYICFANDEKEPFIYIICDNIQYEEII